MAEFSDGLSSMHGGRRVGGSASARTPYSAAVAALVWLPLQLTASATPDAPATEVLHRAPLPLLLIPQMLRVG